MGQPRYDDEAITRTALAAKAGDRQAAAAFVAMTQRQTHRFLSYLAGPDQVEDLVQETYLRALPALARFAARSSARTWLLAIARNVAADHVRANIRRLRTTSIHHHEHALEQSQAKGASRFEEHVLLRRLLDQLPAERRDAFVATQVLGLSYAEAAEVCSCPIGTIRSRVARAREDLIQALHTDRDEPDTTAAT